MAVFLTFLSDLFCNRNQIPFQLGVEQDAKKKKKYIYIYKDLASISPFLKLSKET